MEIHKYLESKLKNCSQYALTKEDQEYIEKYSLKDFLFKEISRKKFRRWKLSDPAREKIDKALDYCLAENKPIIFRSRFGGYKLWRFPTTPEVDWAEFFMLCHYIEYLAPIIAAYKPGIKLYFASDDVFVERLDNIPKSHTEAYYQSFQKLLNQFRKYIPKNFEVDMIRHSSLFKSRKEFELEFDQSVKNAAKKENWDIKRQSQPLEAALKTSEMNINWNGVEDLTKLSDSEKEEKIKQSVLYHDALVQMPTIRQWSSTPDKIAIFTTPLSAVVPIGVTKNSVVRFWVGTGVLEKRNDKYIEHVLSISQYESIKNIPFEEIKINFIPLHNFSNIRLYKQMLNFSNK
ncbi:hypothetical protein KKH39_04440 [Patescibacteria group bacterium]|nr:hypothetical protein [Patescibacteria group bacterium]